MSRSWTFSQVSKNSHVLKWVAPKYEEHRVLVISDAHLDNPDCDRKLLTYHLDQALECDAPIIHCGDLFCMMQGKYDPRSNKSKVLPEHQNDRYIASLIKTTAQWLDPYKDNLVLLGQGNHETSVAKRMEFCVLEALGEALKANGAITEVGGYSGYLKLQMRDGEGGRGCGKKLWYDHGFGGGGPVTQGKIDFNRYLTRVDADVIVSGHVHYKEAFPVRQLSMTERGTIVQKDVWCLRCGSYKDEFKAGEGGWHVERGMGPRPLGGWWLNIYFSPRRNNWEIAIESTRY